MCLILQEKINQLFSDYLSRGVDGDTFSLPLIPRISAEYLKNRLVIVGQETNTWYAPYSQFKHKGPSCCLEAYDDFISNHASTYPGKFWEFSRSLYNNDKVFSNAMVKDGRLSHVWINLFAMDACAEKNDKNGTPTKNLKIRENLLGLQKDLCFQVLNALEPKIILFLTGPNLDNVIERYALNNLPDINGQRLDQLIPCRALARCVMPKDSCLRNANIIRSYHPTYFMLKFNRRTALFKNIQEKGKVVPPQKYFYNAVLRALKDRFVVG